MTNFVVIVRNDSSIIRKWENYLKQLKEQIFG